MSALPDYLTDAEYINRAMADRYASEVREKRTALRDQIAIAAMQGLLSRSEYSCYALVCKMAYEYADEMLKAREQ